MLLAAMQNTWLLMPTQQLCYQMIYRMVLMGFSTEPLIVTSEIIGNRSRIIGSTQNNQEYLYEALDYVAKGKVKVIAETYSLHDIAQAYENVAAGNVRFRAVINI
jgi:alcohol dehydrogenase